jgi:trehalose-6-phosphate synthase
MQPSRSPRSTGFTTGRIGASTEGMRDTTNDEFSEPVIVLANRAPYRHERAADNRIVTTRVSSGVVSAAEPLVLDRGGVWIAEGIGRVDREALIDRDGLDVPGRRRSYRLRRVFLPRDVRRGYYDGFANGALWPLCHRTAIEPAFGADDFGFYEAANRRFADAVVDEATGPSPNVFVQDYHFALAPAMIRRRLPMSRVATFWHIPWPRTRTFMLCPWSRTLLDGLLGSDLIGFQTDDDRDQFLEALSMVDRDLARDEHAIVHGGREIRVGVYPASIQWPSSLAATAPGVEACRVDVRREHGLPFDTSLAIGVDRLDYTKGLEQKFAAVERLLSLHPDLIGRFSLVQLVEPSRGALPAYQATRRRVLEAAERVNHVVGSTSAPAIIVREAHHDALTIFRHFRAADVCCVASLHDGMNLVSKEFVSAREDERGVLVLSAFAGAARELRDALVVNPYDSQAMARALFDAIVMPAEMQRARMRSLREVVARADARAWAANMAADLRGVTSRRRREAEAHAGVGSELPVGYPSQAACAVSAFIPTLPS